jgi:hypothetical protein
MGMNLRTLLLRSTVLISLLAIISPATVQSAVSAHTKKLIEGTKKEGKVVWYTTMTITESKKMLDRLQKKYPSPDPQGVLNDLFYGPNSTMITKKS